MQIKNIVNILTSIGIAGSILFLAPFIIYVIVPAISSLTPEKRLEQFIDEQCLQGNQVAISIRKSRYGCYLERDHRLIRAAIEGNEHAIKALNIEDNSNRTRLNR